MIAAQSRAGSPSRNVTIFLWYTLTKGLTLALTGLVFNLYLYALGYDKGVIGLLNALPAMTSLLCSVPAGMLGDRIGPHKMLLITGFLTPFSVLGLSLGSTIPLLAAFSLANGVISTFYWVSGIPLLAESTSPERRISIFSINSFLLWGVGSLGYVVGGQIVQIAAAILHQTVHSVEALRWGMLTIVAIGVIGALPLLWLHAGSRQTRPRSERLSHDLGLYLRLLGPDVLLTCGGGAVAGFIGLYLTLRFGMRPGSLGTFLTVSGMIGGVLVLFAPRVATRLGTVRAAILLQAAGVPAIMLLTLAPNQFLAMSGETLRNAFRSLGDPVYNAFVMSRVPPEQRATISGLYSTTWSIGFSLGPAISGLVQQRSGFTPAFLLGATLMSSGATLLWFFFLRSGVTGTRTAPGSNAAA